MAWEAGLDEQSKQQALDAFRETPPDGEYLTSNTGVKVSDDQNSLKAGVRGPTLMEDFLLREKITHFDHERIPERVVHARGSAAHGFFQVYEPLADITAARFLQDPAAKTPVFLRFSTVAGSRGSADTARDVRGFAVKFYTEEGNFDLVGNNIPVFFIQDAIKFPDLIHAAKPEPHNEIPQAQTAHDTFWDFISLTPEAMHMIVWVMSDRGIPRSYRMMEGFGVNTFRLVNAKGEARFVKFHWKPLLGVHSLVWDEAQKLGGKDPDFHRRDLWDAIEQGDFPEWELGFQLIEEADELKFGFDPLDATKIWPEDVVPVRRVGKLTLNRNPDNFFAETEQVAFHTGHVVPGIDFSNDPLLQGRLFSYLDTQLTRLGGPNFNEIPINRPIVEVHNNQRDGIMRTTINPGRVGYFPNSLGGGCPMQAPGAKGGFVSQPARVEGQKIRERSPSFGDHYSQATLFYSSMSTPEQEHIVQALQFELGKVETVAIRERMVAHLAGIDADLAMQVALGIGVAAPRKMDAATAVKRASELVLEVTNDGATVGTNDLTAAEGDPTRKAPALSMMDTVKGSVKSRKVAILAADGVNGSEVAAMKQALADAGAHTKVIAPHLGTIQAEGSEPLPVDMTLAGSGSVMFDAIYVPGGAKSVQALRAQGDAIHFVNEAFRHCKAIAATGEGVELLAASGIAAAAGNGGGLPDDPALIVGRAAGEAANVSKAFIQAIAQHRNYARQRKEMIPA